MRTYIIISEWQDYKGKACQKGFTLVGENKKQVLEQFKRDNPTHTIIKLMYKFSGYWRDGKL